MSNYYEICLFVSYIIMKMVWWDMYVVWWDHAHGVMGYVCGMMGHAHGVMGCVYGGVMGYVHVVMGYEHGVMIKFNSMNFTHRILNLVFDNISLGCIYFDNW